ncbi:MAG: arylsulfatase, partial [Planctomycetes bacterium]|nr:arylsulfatase [Planctomycetota bacterium]
ANPRDHYFYYYGKQLRCVRQGDWKLHFPHTHRSYVGVEPGQDGLNGPTAQGKTSLELYNLKNDVSETTDVADQYPDIVARLQTLAEKARYELGDALTERIGHEIRPPGRIE